MTLERSNSRRAAQMRARRGDAEQAIELTDAQRRELREQLLARRTSLIAAIEGRRNEERDTGRDVGDEMDEANLEGNVGINSKLLERDVRLLAEIDRALAKF